jgi:AraC-like DNA-binding protein
MILAPLYNFYFILVFWNVSVANFCWLLPIPLGAYVLFLKKEVIAYTAYILVLIITGSFIANIFSSNFPMYSQRQVMFTDTLLFLSNILIIVLLIYYKDKIRKQEMLSRIEDQRTRENNPNNLESTYYDLDTELMENLFEGIEIAMTKNELFRDIKINLSKLSVVLEVNSSYISKAIRYKGYPNFSTYLNIYRVNHVKKLLLDSDFQKITLMYVYTEAGFSNQSTFNRVFKQIEGITPSEYLQKNIKNTIHQ